MPDVFVISGPNGAGKTTAAMSLFPDLLECLEYVNADAIATGISPFQPNDVAFEAGKLMMQRIKKLSLENKNFAFETTLSSKIFANLLLRWKEQNGYNIALLYVWVETPSLAIKRVKSRVMSGGHDIPEPIVKRRYSRSINNLINLYLPIADNVFIVNNSYDHPSEVAQKEIDGKLEILDQQAWNLLETYYENE